MESSMISSENNSGLSSETIRSLSIDHEEEAGEDESPEESGWTEYLEDFSDYVRRLEGGGEKEEEEEETSHGDDYSNHTHSMMRSASMVSDAGSGPEWRTRNYNHINNIPKRLNMKRAKEMPYDDSLEDTASSPVNSPKITMGLKRMDINCRRADEAFDTYHGKGRAIESRHDDDEGMDVVTNMNMNGSSPSIHQQGKLLGEKGLCLVPVTMLINFNNYRRLPRV